MFVILAEDYTEELAVAHIRRLLDIVACTTSFGGSSNSLKSSARTSPKDSGPKDIGSKESCLKYYEAALPSPESGGDQSSKYKSEGIRDKKAVTGSGGGAKGFKNLDGSYDGSEKADGSVSMCPPPRLGQFYEFFSFSHLTPPVQCELSAFLLGVEIGGNGASASWFYILFLDLCFLF